MRESEAYAAALTLLEARKDERRKVWRNVAALAALRRDCYRENDPAWTDLNSIVQEALKNAKE